MISILSSIISTEFEKNIGKWQSKNEKKYAMKIKFRLSLHDYDIEDGYRNLEILIYGDANYVGVYTRENWIIIPINEVNSNGDGLRKGKDYRSGNSNWIEVANHDSCWRDGIKKILDFYKDKINYIDTFSNWYEKIEVTDEIYNDIDCCNKSLNDLGKYILTFKLEGKKIIETFS